MYGMDIASESWAGDNHFNPTKRHMRRLLKPFRSKWVRIPLIAWVLYISVSVTYLGITRHSTRTQGTRERQVVLERLDREDPGWRFAQIEVARSPVPEKENSALVASQLQHLIPGNGQLFPARRNKSGLDLHEIPPNRLLDDEADQLIRTALLGTEEALPLAIELAKCPVGRRSLTAPTDVMTSKWNIDIVHYYVTQYLRLSFERTAGQLSSDETRATLLAMLNLGRMHGDEPVMRSQSSRIALARSAVGMLERTLALGVEGGDLSSLQAELDRESKADWYRVGVRGHRAFAHEACQAIEDGRVPLHDVRMLNATCGNRAPRYLEMIDEWRVQPSLPADHAICLDLLTRFLKVADLPESQQADAVARLPIPNGSVGTRLQSTFLSRVPQFADDALLTRAMLRCAVAAIAIERFRLLNGDWPLSLGDIPQAILPSIPLDPFTDKPLVLVTRREGVTVYSLGFDATDDGGTLDPRSRRGDRGTDIGFRLYNVDQRRLPALPVPPKGKNEDLDL